MYNRFFQHRTLQLTMLLTILILLAGCAGQSSDQPGSQSNNKPAVSTTPAIPASGTPGAVSFAKDIQPILQSTCFSCHGGERISRGLDMHSYASLMTGSQNGAVILPGNADKSLFIQSVQSGQMPKRGSPLSPSQISLLVQWVNSGAKNN